MNRTRGELLAVKRGFANMSRMERLRREVAAVEDEIQDIRQVDPYYCFDGLTDSSGRRQRLTSQRLKRHPRPTMLFEMICRNSRHTLVL
jgi:hypothetical protein